MKRPLGQGRLQTVVVGGVTIPELVYELQVRKSGVVRPGGNLSGRRDVAVVVTGSNAGGAEASDRARSGGLGRSAGPPSAQRRCVSVEIAWQPRAVVADIR